jgi:hypothetical protein
VRGRQEHQVTANRVDSLEPNAGLAGICELQTSPRSWPSSKLPVCEQLLCELILLPIVWSWQANDLNKLPAFIFNDESFVETLKGTSNQD